MSEDEPERNQVAEALRGALDFRHVGPSDSGKTEIWQVIPKGGQYSLGRINWYGPWRKYVFSPNADTVFEETCLREIASFTCGRTIRHRDAKARGESHGRRANHS